MLFTAEAWPGLAAGTITLTFRAWSKPQAKKGGRYRVGGMLLEATEVVEVRAGDIRDRDARRAGASDAKSLLARMRVSDPDRRVFRVTLRYLGADDRVAKRNDDALDESALAALVARLAKIDARADEAWTRDTLRIIGENPGVVSTTLAARVGKERMVFKLDVRKLKELGLTESLEVGYRLSPRGVVVLRALTR